MLVHFGDFPGMLMYHFCFFNIKSNFFVEYWKG